MLQEGTVDDVHVDRITSLNNDRLEREHGPENVLGDDLHHRAVSPPSTV